MKKIVLLFVFMVTLITHAQEVSDFKAETIEFMKLTGVIAAFDNAINQIGYNVLESNKEAYVKEANTTIEGLLDKMAELYMEEFTHEEIKELITFYKTNVGNKLASKQITLSEKAMSIGQSWGIEVSNIAEKYN